MNPICDTSTYLGQVVVFFFKKQTKILLDSTQQLKRRKRRRKEHFRVLHCIKERFLNLFCMDEKDFQNKIIIRK